MIESAPETFMHIQTPDLHSVKEVFKTSTNTKTYHASERSQTQRVDQKSY